MDFNKVKSVLASTDSHVLIGKCLDCDFEDNVDKCETEYEWDAFKGNDVPYWICPKCGGGIEI